MIDAVEGERDDVVYNAMMNAIEQLRYEDPCGTDDSSRVSRSETSHAPKRFCYESSDSSDWEMDDGPIACDIPGGDAVHCKKMIRNVESFSSQSRPTSQKIVPPKNEDHATQMFAAVSPAFTSIEDFKMLLNARANPNARKPGCLSSLAKVLTFAMPCHVKEMRELLLDAGAVETNALKMQWDLRQRADASEAAWQKAFHNDPR